MPIRYRGAKLKAKGGAVLMAPCSETHHCDQDQRRIELKTVAGADGVLHLSPPENAQLAPPGDYFLFLVSDHGVPSTGLTVRVEASAPSQDTALPTVGRGAQPKHR